MQIARFEADARNWNQEVILALALEKRTLIPKTFANPHLLQYRSKPWTEYSYSNIRVHLSSKDLSLWQKINYDSCERLLAYIDPDVLFIYL